MTRRVLVLGTFVMWYGHFIVKSDDFSGIEAALIGVSVALVTPLGDLFESLLKRSAGVKDSGALLGEHGGVLDRIDALLPVLPLAMLLLG